MKQTVIQHIYYKKIGYTHIVWAPSDISAAS